MNRSVNKKGVGIGTVAIRRNQEKNEHIGHLTFPVTNNEVEYEALLERLQIAKNLGAEKLENLIDS